LPDARHAPDGSQFLVGMLQVVQPDRALDLWSNEVADGRAHHAYHWLPYCQHRMPLHPSETAYPKKMLTGDPIDEAPYQVRPPAWSEASAGTISPRA